MFRILRIAAISCAALLTPIVSVWTVVSGAPPIDRSTDDPFKIYDAVLNNNESPKSDFHALIPDDTLNFKCGTASGNPILLNDCGGMVFPPDTPKDVYRMLRGNWPQLKKSTWDDLETKNAASVKLHDGFVTPWKHRPEGSDIAGDDSAEWKSPDCAFYFSSPGFSSDHSQAIVFVFFASYMQGAPSTGDYFLLQWNETTWVIKDRIQYFKTDGTGAEPQPSPDPRSKSI